MRPYHPKGQRVARIIRSALVGVMINGAGRPTQAQSTAQPTPLQTQRFVVPLIVDNEERDEVFAVIAPGDDRPRFDRAPILRQLESQLRPELVLKLKSAGDPDGRLTVTDLHQLGLRADFDTRRLELRLSVPPELRRDTTTHLFGRTPPRGREQSPAPATFSGYLNLLMGMDYVEQTSHGVNEGRQPFHTDFESAINFHNYVVEGVVTYVEDGRPDWQRGDVRLVHDDPDRMLRWAVGDLSYPATGFQNFQPLAGITVARNFSLQPYRVTEPLGQTSFFLRSSSRVEVLINGRLVQTLQLPAGPHSLRDFLFASGSNAVELRITDDVGRVESVRLSFFYDTRLLAQGEQEFAYSVGVPSHLAGAGKSYETEQPAFSLFHRIGLTDTLTTGLNAQGNADQQMLGIEAAWATPFGTFQPDLAVSRTDACGFDSAWRLGYTYFDAGSPWGSSWSAAIQHRGRHFAALGNLDPHNSIATEISARYGQRLPWQMSAGIGGSYQLHRDRERDTTSINASLNKSFGRGSNLNITFDRRTTTTGETDHRALLTVTLLWPDGRNSIRASYDTLSDTARASWRYASARVVGGLAAELGAQRTRDDYSVFGNARYTGYRGEFELAQNVTTPQTASEQVESRTSARLGTALVFADGQFALSRPVRDSFAIVVPHREFAAQTIGVDPVDGRFSARSDVFGPAVVPDLSSYLVRNLVVDAPDLPFGYELGPRTRTVFPTYKSGTILRVGEGVTVLLVGVLANADGRPVALQAGQITALHDPQCKPVAMFTNRNGRFAAAELRPGTYELRADSAPTIPVRFVIPTGTAGRYDVGTLRLMREAPAASDVSQARLQ